jgi:putative nucleotidyltransferase with HDIG domain
MSKLPAPGPVEHMQRTRFAAGLVRVAAMHDEDTATHLRATAALARRIAQQMQLPQTQILSVELTGLLHDIGKVAVDRGILNKPAELTASEWDAMRAHAEFGAAAIAELSALADLAPLVRAHHERMDGEGYPDRLLGEEIPLEARIVAVADAFHALTSDRPYRRAVLPQTALDVLEHDSGTQFDADVVLAALKLLNAGRASRTKSA